MSSIRGVRSCKELVGGGNCVEWSPRFLSRIGETSGGKKERDGVPEQLCKEEDEEKKAERITMFS